MNDLNRRRLEYWANNDLPDTCRCLVDAISKGETEWVIRHLLTLSHSVYVALQYATNTSQYDKHPPVR